MELDAFLSVGFSVFEGDAKAWAMFTFDSCRNFREFYKAFLDEFWGHAKQRELRWSVDHGTYSQASGKSFATYFQQLATQAQYLTPPYDEPYLVRSLAAHFPAFVGSRLAGVYTVREATVLLRELDEIHSRPRRTLPNVAPGAPPRDRERFFGNKTNPSDKREHSRPRISHIEDQHTPDLVDEESEN